MIDISIDPSPFISLVVPGLAVCLTGSDHLSIRFDDQLTKIAYLRRQSMRYPRNRLVQCPIQKPRGLPQTEVMRLLSLTLADMGAVIGPYSETEFPFHYVHNLEKYTGKRGTISGVQMSVANETNVGQPRSPGKDSIVFIPKMPIGGVGTNPAAVGMCRDICPSSTPSKSPGRLPGCQA
jgi:hypothetical protein